MRSEDADRAGPRSQGRASSPEATARVKPYSASPGSVSSARILNLFVIFMWLNINILTLAQDVVLGLAGADGCF